MFLRPIVWLQNRIEQREHGATAVEYGLLVALIAIAIVVVVTTLGTTLSDKFQEVVDNL